MNPKRLVLGLAVAGGLSSAASAQLPPTTLPFPNAPGAIPQVIAPAPVPPNPVGIAPRPAMPTQPTLASFLGVSRDQREYRARAMADTPFGQLRSRVNAPLNRLSGGLIPKFPPQSPSLAELQDPGPIGAAAAVKQDRLGAEKRMKAVQYLASVDCSTWPEAEAALIGALRQDRNESVRLQAATVLGGGCCCTKKTIKALAESAAGTDCDGGLAEKSPRVRAAAQAALDHCLSCFIECQSACPDKNCDKKDTGGGAPPPAKELLPPPTPKPIGKGDEPAPTPKKGDTGPGTSGMINGRPMTSFEAYYEKVAHLPAAEVIAEARKVLSQPLPAVTIGGASNQLDLEAAGAPAWDDARSHSPKSSSLLSMLTSPEPAVGPVVAAGRPVGMVTNAVVHQAAGTPAVAVKQTTAVATTAPKATMPPPVAAPKATAAPVRTPAAPRMMTGAMTSPTVAEMRVTPAGGPGVGGSRADKCARMFKSVVPVPDLVMAIEQLTPEDLHGSPALVNELVMVGSQASTQPVRLASVRALVRCRVSTPAAVSTLQTLAQYDPDPAVRSAAGQVVTAGQSK